MAKYGEDTILDGVSVDIYKGEVFGVLGGSGCGKSTLLKHLIGLLQPYSGQVIIDGDDIADCDEKKLQTVLRKIGVLYQSAALFGSMTLAENVALPVAEYTDLDKNSIDHLVHLKGKKALIITDEEMVRLGFVEVVKTKLAEAGLDCAVFDQVEPEPSLGTVKRGAAQMLEQQPDWIVGLGGGSALDAAKAMWILYERPDLAPEEINPLEEMGLRRKARMVAIPTTSGTGSETTWAVVLTDIEQRHKISTGAPECTPDIAIVDPLFAARMPPRLTADTEVWIVVIRSLHVKTDKYDWTILPANVLGVLSIFTGTIGLASKQQLFLA